MVKSMEFKIIRLRACLLLIFCSLSWFAVAQTNDKELLLGEWVWENALIDDSKRPMAFDLHNSYYKFYGEVEIKNNTVFLKNSEEKTQEVKYETNENYLGLDLPSGESFIAEWAIIEDKLYLEFSSNDIYDLSKKVDVLLVYKRK